MRSKGEKNLPAVDLSCSDYQRLTAPGGTSKYLQSLLLKGWRRRFNSVPGHHDSKGLNSFLAELLSPLSVRYFSARSGSVPGYDDGEGLNLELPFAQSAFSPHLSAAWLKIAVSIAPAHAILADTVGITLQGQLNITVAEQSLYRFWVSSNAD